MAEPFQWHEMQWDEAKAARMWDFFARTEALQADYFSRQVGAGLINFLRCMAPLPGRTLDYGCGPGHLVEQLLKAGIACEGLDFSAASVAKVNERWGGHSFWRGAKVCDGDRLPYPDGSFDLVLCVETIEHVLPQHLGPMLRELRRVLKPGLGLLFITTPNGEDLARSQVGCPECGSVFHRYQHLRAFSRDSLETLLTRHGLRTSLCSVTDFSRFQTPAPSLRSLSGLKQRCKELYRELRSGPGLPGAPIRAGRLQSLIGSGHHLFWLGTAG